MKVMLLGVILMLLSQSFNALGLEWAIFIAGLVLGIVGFFMKEK